MWKTLLIRHLRLSLRKTFNDFGVEGDVDDAQFVRDSLARMPPQIETREIVDFLSKKFRLAAITNSDNEVVDTLIEVHGLPIKAAITFEEKGV